MTTWLDMQGLMLGDPRVKKVQQIGYPRSFLHQDVVKLHNSCLLIRGKPNESCHLYPSARHAASSKAFILETAKNDVTFDRGSVEVCDIDLRADGDLQSASTGLCQVSIIRLYAVFFPKQMMNVAMSFWRLTGTGISSRLAESLHEHMEHQRQVPSSSDLDQGFKQHRISNDVTVSNTICERITYLLKRASLQPAISEKLSPSDVFLYPTGMSAIYHCNFLLQSWKPAESIVFGFPYELTLKLLQTYGISCRFYGLGTPGELDEMETYLQLEASRGRRVQSVWCECASNPLLRTVDLKRIRSLADKYGFQVVVDDTIGSFANVDLLGTADIIITSLTKSFSGCADVMAGSIVLNPASPFYTTTKRTLSLTYGNELYAADAVKLESNSRKFLQRASKMNQNASFLVSLLQKQALNPSSVLKHVYYPSTCWSLPNYREMMRPVSPEFTPGYGGLFTLEFESERSASTFFNALELHKGPSLGANITLAQPYVQTVFARDKAWAASYGLDETIIRISAGLEDEKVLGKAFQKALRLADCTKIGALRHGNYDGCI